MINMILHLNFSLWVMCQCQNLKHLLLCLLWMHSANQYILFQLPAAATQCKEFSNNLVFVLQFMFSYGFLMIQRFLELLILSKSERTIKHVSKFFELVKAVLGEWEILAQVLHLNKGRNCTFCSGIDSKLLTVPRAIPWAGSSQKNQLQCMLKIFNWTSGIMLLTAWENTNESDMDEEKKICDSICV